MPAPAHLVFHARQCWVNAPVPRSLGPNTSPSDAKERSHNYSNPKGWRHGVQNTKVRWCDWPLHIHIRATLTCDHFNNGRFIIIGDHHYWRLQFIKWSTCTFPCRTMSRTNGILRKGYWGDLVWISCFGSRSFSIRRGGEYPYFLTHGMHFLFENLSNVLLFA
jgi:hypothetical protein